MTIVSWLAGLSLLSIGAAEPGSGPKVTDARLKIERFAAEPDVVTPTGLTVDSKGRVLVIESHTHFRPDNYPGPKADRIRLLEDLDHDGRAEKVSTFFEGSKYTMGLAFHPASPATLFVATRYEVFTLKDNDGDGRADGPPSSIAKLETSGNYPHNGLSGFAFDAEGWVYFGLGENLGASYKLVARDGTTLTGGGEGGNVYRCKPDGAGLERVATGFWNPFHLAFDTYGRLFAVDNDPDSRPPCRLLHVVPGGDYGYRFRNGRKGLHPFTAWNGELPGTLPMTAGTGEAPSGVLAYESDDLPDEYRGSLLTTSWGDHRIERFVLRPKGASFEAKAEAVVTGGEDFRPVAIATAPDGTIYISDWVDKSYPLHRKGRVWKLSARSAPKRIVPENDEAALSHLDRRMREAAARRLAAGDEAARRKLRGIVTDHADPRARAAALDALMTTIHPGDDEALKKALGDSSVDVRAIAARRLPRRLLDPSNDAKPDPSPLAWSDQLRNVAGTTAPGNDFEASNALKSDDPFLRQAGRVRLRSVYRGHTHFVAMLASGPPAIRREAVVLLRDSRDFPDPALKKALRDPDPEVRFVAVQWVGEEKLTGYRDDLREGLASSANTRQLFEAYLAALERLDSPARGPRDEQAGESYVAALLTDPATSPALRVRALRMLRPDHPALTLERLKSYLESPDETLRIEAVRSLRETSHPGRFALLTSIADDAERPAALRAEAIVGLGDDLKNQKELLIRLAEGSNATLRHEALRSLRGVTLSAVENTRVAAYGRQDHETSALLALLAGPKPGQPAPASEPLSVWLSRVEGTGSADEGERVFFSGKGAACYRCHQFDGRGGRVGPDLTTTAKTLTRERLVESIVNPSKEIAPQYVAWLVARKDGTVFTGMFVDESASGEQIYVTEKGERIVVKPSDIEERKPQAASIMPADLAHAMTAYEFRDLIAFLRRTKD